MVDFEGGSGREVTKDDEGDFAGKEMAAATEAGKRGLLSRGKRLAREDPA